MCRVIGWGFGFSFSIAPNKLRISKMFLVIPINMSSMVTPVASVADLAVAHLALGS